MIKKTISEIQQDYDLQLDRVVKTIKQEKAKKVLLQFPEGLKQYATSIVDYLESQVKNVTFFIWLGTCFGACDLPPVDKRIDLVIQFGHSSWKYDKKKEIKVLN
jgi:2-(3-amino-3-carboxypropyl)histidine synthase